MIERFLSFEEISPVRAASAGNVLPESLPVLFKNADISAEASPRVSPVAAPWDRLVKTAETCWDSAVFTSRSQGAATGLTLGEASAEMSAFLKSTGRLSGRTFPALAALTGEISSKLKNLSSISELPEAERKNLRTSLYLAGEGIGKLSKTHGFANPEDQKTCSLYKSDADRLTKYIPVWVKVSVALALGLGTMIGWKRIVITVGEKIGKSHLTYAQGASAELVAMATIGAA